MCPYIEPDDRGDLVPSSSRPAKTEGELNFQITRLLMGYLDENSLCYETIGDIRGALVNAGDEFYRRVAAPYEDYKRNVNGDVYHPYGR